MDPVNIVPTPPQPIVVEEDPARKSEIEKLKRELFSTEDGATQAAIEGRLAQLGAMPKPVPESSVPEPELPLPPTPAALNQAERMIREARVEKMRGSKQKALDMVKEAAALAPGSAMVQEALGDDLNDRSRLEEAKRAYRLAVRLDPTNVGVERKHAAIVAKMGGMGDIDEQMRAALSDGFMPATSETMASGPAVMLLSGMLPGLGQLVSGRIPLGIGFLTTWIISGLWLLFKSDDVTKIFAGKGGNSLVLAPLAIMGVTWMVSMYVSSSQSKGVGKKSVNRPLPPVDMKFD